MPPNDAESNHFPAEVAALPPAGDALHRAPMVSASPYDAAITALEAAGQVEALRGQLVAMFGVERVGCLDRLPSVARAALHAHADWQALDHEPDVRAIAAELLAERKSLRDEVGRLVSQGDVDAHALTSQSQLFSYTSLCRDVLALTATLDAARQLPSLVTLVSVDDIAHAQALVDELLRALGRRTQRRPSALAVRRAEAFALLLSTYDDVRRLVTFLRWKERDADLIAPSLFAASGSAGGKKRAANRKRTEK